MVSPTPVMCHIEIVVIWFKYALLIYYQGRSQDSHQGGAQLESEVVVVVCSEAVHGQLCWP